MQILLANAKIMRTPSESLLRGEMTVPQFQSVANEMAAEISQMDIDELARQFGCSRAIAAENWKRYQNFHCAEPMPAILAYNGQAYKHLKADTLSKEALQFGQKHLWITCFLYGLLRPMDAVVPYRIKAPLLSPEGEDIIAKATRKTTLLSSEGEDLIAKVTNKEASPRGGWRGLLTDVLIDSVKADDGVLIHLSTEEYEHLFDWKRVKQEVRVIQPLFYVRRPDGGLKMQAVWAKACRGAMVRYILQNEITSPEELKGFSHVALPRKTGELGGGCFDYNPNIGEEAFPHFIREQ